MQKCLNGQDDQRCRNDWQLLNGPHWSEFSETLRTPATVKNLKYSLIQFLSDPLIKMSAEDFIILGKNNPSATQELIKNYILHHKKAVIERKLAAGTLVCRTKAAEQFLVMNDILAINWKKLSKITPSRRKSANDRAPTLEEIQKVDRFGDARFKFVLSAMVSGGFRLGGWTGLQVKDFEKIEKDGQIVAAKLTLYRGTDEQYFTFVSPECWNRFQDYVDLRRKAGENVTGDSPAVRNQFGLIGCFKRDVNNVKSLSIIGISASFSSAWRTAGYRLEGKGQKEVKLIHSFRKYYKTRAEQTMKPINVEILMGHATGVSDSYYRPLEADLLSDYLKAVKDLCIEPVNRAGEAASQIELEELRQMIKNLTNRINNISQV